MNTLNKAITWNPLREMAEAQNRFNPFFLGGFPNRMGSGEIHSLAVADWSPEVDISEDDHGYLLKAAFPANARARRKIRKRNSIALSDPLAISDAASRCLKMPTARK
jgi:HSP20 family protein